jgi:hypothetical protein
MIDLISFYVGRGGAGGGGTGGPNKHMGQVVGVEGHIQTMQQPLIYFYTCSLFKQFKSL